MPSRPFLRRARSRPNVVVRRRGSPASRSTRHRGRGPRGIGVAGEDPLHGAPGKSDPLSARLHDQELRSERAIGNWIPKRGAHALRSCREAKPQALERVLQQLRDSDRARSAPRSEAALQPLRAPPSRSPRSYRWIPTRAASSRETKHERKENRADLRLESHAARLHRERPAAPASPVWAAVYMSSR